jgi:hypothetical protein
MGQLRKESAGPHCKQGGRERGWAARWGRGGARDWGSRRAGARPRGHATAARAGRGKLGCPAEAPECQSLEPRPAEGAERRDGPRRDRLRRAEGSGAARKDHRAGKPRHEGAGPRVRRQRARVRPPRGGEGEAPGEQGSRSREHGTASKATASEWQAGLHGEAPASRGSEAEGRPRARLAAESRGSRAAARERATERAGRRKEC